MRLDDLDGWLMDVHDHDHDHGYAPMCFGPKPNQCIQADMDGDLEVEFEDRCYDQMVRTYIPIAVLVNYLRTIGFHVVAPGSVEKNDST